MATSEWPCGVIAQFATGNLFSASPAVIGVQAGALLLFLWARLTFGWRSYHVVANPTEGGLVTSGPYRYIRHPIYTAMSVLSAAGVVAHWSWASGLLGGLVVGCALLRIFSEEVLVTARYPEYPAGRRCYLADDSLRVLILEQGRLGFDASSIDRNHKLTGGVAVIHENLHLLKVLVAGSAQRRVRWSLDQPPLRLCQPSASGPRSKGRFWRVARPLSCRHPQRPLLVAREVRVLFSALE